jgi:uncharacterized protein VirK/YbjX
MAAELSFTTVANKADIVPTLDYAPEVAPLLWSKLPGVFWRLLIHLGTHMKVIRYLRRQPFAETVQNNPKFAFKYLSPNYLAKGLSVTEGAACFLHHYKRLYDTLPNRILRQTLHWDSVLYQAAEGDNLLSLAMGMSRPNPNEGEMSLFLKWDGEILFTLSFTIVPGKIVNSESEEILLISRLQGTPGRLSDRLGLAVKTLHRVGPRRLLLAALEGIATACGITEIASVSAKNQVSHCEEFDAIFKYGYDDFFTEMEIGRTSAGFFLTPVPILEKPLSLIKSRHKLQTKRRRAFKQQIQSACAESFQRMCHGAAGAPLTFKANLIQPESESQSGSEPAEPSEQENETLRQHPHLTHTRPMHVEEETIQPVKDHWRVEAG